MKTKKILKKQETKKEIIDKDLQPVIDLFESTFKEPYLNLQNILWRIYNLLKEKYFVFNDLSQKRFLACLMLLQKYGFCYDVNENKYSMHLKKFLNFFLFFMKQNKYFLWNGFEISSNFDNQTQTNLWRSLNHISYRISFLVNQNIEKIQKFIIDYFAKKQDNLLVLKELYFLTWNNELSNIKSMFDVLGNYLISDNEFVDYYFSFYNDTKKIQDNSTDETKISKMITSNNTKLPANDKIVSEDEIILKNLFNVYYKLNQNTKFNWQKQNGFLDLWFLNLWKKYIDEAII